MGRENLFAHTEPGSNYPAFISVNKTDSDTVEVTIRAKAKEDGSCGDTSSITQSMEKYANLLHKAKDEEIEKLIFEAVINTDTSGL